MPREPLPSSTLNPCMPGCNADFGSAKLIVFDFDQTISTFHVYSRLAKRSSVDERSATSEIGQLRLIDELDAANNNSAGSFAREAIGGENRLRALLRFFTLMRDRGVCMVVCTYGIAAAVNKVLSQLGLLEFFSEVYGRGPGGPVKYQAKAYDKALEGQTPTASEAAFFAKPEHYKWQEKKHVITTLRERKRLNCSEVIFADDDPEMLRNAMGSCWTIWIKDHSGLCKDHLDEMEWRTRPSRLPSLLINCLEPFVSGKLRGHTEAQVKESEEKGDMRMRAAPTGV